MCGVCAVISFQKPIDAAILQKMTIAAAHRGPDGHGLDIFQDESQRHSVGLGHTRLSVIDLSEGSRQPFISLDGKHALTFNGEIYNYLELRSELVKLGQKFTTSGDTEVLLMALKQWGVDALQRLRGMFAFVYVDLRENKIIAARDEFGIKPLFRYEDKDGIYFASEIKQFVSLPGFLRRLNHEAAGEFLLYGLTDHRATTHFRGVQHVPPGWYYVIDGSRGCETSTMRWRDESRELFGGSYQDAVHEYRRLLLDSVSVHMRSDVDVGSCLSGGLDSSAIVGAVSSMRQRLDSRQHTFTATSENEQINEFRYADDVSRFCGTIPHYVQPTVQDLWQNMESLAWYQDEPFGSTSIFAQWQVFREASRLGIKVMLDGQGADEQLGGYDSFVNTFLFDQLKRFELKRFVRSYREFSGSNRTDSKRLVKFLVYSSLSERSVKTIGRLVGVGSQNHIGWVNPHLPEITRISDPYRLAGRVPSNVRSLSTDMVFRSNLPMLLRFEDRNSMAHGVEARVPFVDGPLMKFALSLPPEYLISTTLTKPLLRDAVGDLMPPIVRHRRDKIGFQTAEGDWLKSEHLMVEVLVDEAIQRLPSLFSERTKEKTSRILRGQEQFNNIPWRVLSLLLWARVHDVND